MKRIKFLIIAGILACTFGCRDHDVTMVPIDNSNNVSIINDNTDNVSTEDNNVFDEDIIDNSDEKQSIYDEGSPEYLFEQFINGEIDAEILYPTETDREIKLNFSDLNINHKDWTFESYSAGEQIDLDNDGENELIINGPYGGMYLDAIDGKLYVFAQAQGNAGSLDYTYYDGAYWIVIKDVTHGGRLYYDLYKYQGGDNLVDSMSLKGEWRSEDDKEFIFNEETITEDDFNRIHDDLFHK